MGLFGSELKVTNGFSKTYSDFANETKNAKSNMDSLKGSIKDAESAAGSSMGSMRSQAMSLAGEYRKMGLSQSDALKKAWSEIDKNSKSSSDNVKKNWKNSFSDIKKDGENAFKGVSNSMNSVLSTVTKLTAGYLSLKGAVGLVKSSITDASSFQNASTFLGAVYGAQGQAKYKWATDEASKTPFSEMEVVNGLARAHALGLKDDANNFKMYEDLGSFAKIQGVGDLNSAIDALSDAKSGQWERLQTITGMKREQLESFAEDNNLGTFTNKKGQVTDSDLLMKVIQSYMDKQGISGMTDKFSKTFSGRMSTLKGNTEKTLAEMAGIKDDGTIKDGSLFDNASKGMEKLINSVNRFSKSESFDRIADGLGKLGNSIINGLDYVTEHPEIAEGIVKIGGALMGLKVAETVLSPLSSLCGGIKKLGLLTTGVGGIAENTAKASTGLLGLSKSLGLLTVAAVSVESFINKSGVLHKVFNGAMNTINGNSKEKGTMHDYATEAVAGFQEIGLSGINTFAKITGNEGLKRWVNDTWKSIETEVATDNSRINGAKIYSDNEKDKWYTGSKKSDWNTIPDMVSSGAVTKNTTNSNVNNNYKTDVHLNVATVRETADVDDIANQLANKLNKVFNTRNAIGYSN